MIDCIFCDTLGGKTSFLNYWCDDINCMCWLICFQVTVSNWCHMFKQSLLETTVIVWNWRIKILFIFLEHFRHLAGWCVCDTTVAVHLWLIYMVVVITHKCQHDHWQQVTDGVCCHESHRTAVISEGTIYQME